MRDKLSSISAFLGFGNAEVFPKQVELKSEDDTGNFLNLPYFNHEKQQDMPLILKEKLLQFRNFFISKKTYPTRIRKIRIKKT